MSNAKIHLTELVLAAVELTTEDFTVFVDYGGHVGLVALRAYAGGWVDGASPTLDLHGYMDASKNEYKGVTPVDKLLPALRDHYDRYRESLADPSER